MKKLYIVCLVCLCAILSGCAFGLDSGQGIDIAGNDSSKVVTISGVDAGYYTKGIAEFNPGNFTVVDGAVSLVDLSGLGGGGYNFSSDFSLSGGNVSLATAARLWIPSEYTILFPWMSLDAFNTLLGGGGSGGSIYPGGAGVVLACHNALNAYALISAKGGINNPLAAGKISWFEFPLTYWDSTNQAKAWMMFINDTALGPTLTKSHVGFEILANNHLWSSTGNGTTQELQDTGVIIASSIQLTFLQVECLPNVYAKFYVNGVLRTTHTTVVPFTTTAWYVPYLGVQNTVAGVRYLGVERLLTFRELP